MKLNTKNKFWTELEVLPNNQVKLLKARKYVKVNQFKTYWADVNARDLARGLNQLELVTR